MQRKVCVWFTSTQSWYATLGVMEICHCPLCALPRTAAAAAGVEWSSQHEPNGTMTWICGTCTRAQLWRIETLLAMDASNAGTNGLQTAR